MDTDQQKWDERYRGRALVLPTPMAFVSNSLPLAQPGTVLDLACGDAASALYFARRGFDVIAADISGEALERVHYFARMLGVKVRTVQLDLDSDDWLDILNEVHPGLINNIVVTRYKPSQALWHQLAERLAPEGMLMLTSFNMQQHRIHGFNADYCLQPAEYTGVDPLLSLRYSATVKDGDDRLDEYIFCRPGDGE